MNGYNNSIRSQMVRNALFDDRLIKAKGEDLRRRGHRYMAVLKSIFYKPNGQQWDIMTWMDFAGDENDLKGVFENYESLYKRRFTFTEYDNEYLIDGNKIILKGSDLNGPLVEGIFMIERYAL